MNYNLYIDDGNGVLFNLVYQGVLTSTVIYNLTAGIEYSFKVAAINFNGEGPTSTIAKFKSCVAPSQVKAPTLIASTATTVTLRWS